MQQWKKQMTPNVVVNLDAVEPIVLFAFACCVLFSRPRTGHSSRISLVQLQSAVHANDLVELHYFLHLQRARIARPMIDLSQQKRFFDQLLTASTQGSPI